MFELAPIAFYALAGIASGNVGLWNPDQPIKPFNPVNPVALAALAAVSGGLSGWLTNMAFGKEGMVLGAAGAAIGSILVVRSVKALGLFGKQ